MKINFGNWCHNKRGVVKAVIKTSTFRMSGVKHVKTTHSVQ